MMYRFSLTVTLLFCLALAASAPAGDVAFHIVAGKGQSLIQTNAAGPLMLSTNEPPFQFYSCIWMMASNAVTNATVRLPTGTIIPCQTSMRMSPVLPQ
jgi:hypothetical protein